MMKRVEYNQQDIAIYFGFYGGWELPDTDISDTLGYELTEDQENQWYDEFDYRGYEKAMSIHAVELWNEAIEDLPFLKDIQFVRIWSPQFYNFHTDKLECTCLLDEAGMHKYIYENKKKFWAYVKEKYRDRSGFISFVNYYNFEDFMNPKRQVDKEINRDIMIDWCVYTHLSEDPDDESRFTCRMYDYRDVCMLEHGPYFEEAAEACCG